MKHLEINIFEVSWGLSPAKSCKTLMGSYRSIQIDYRQTFVLGGGGN